MMTRRQASLALLSAAGLGTVPGLAVSTEPRRLDLPPPALGGKSLGEVLRHRRSIREFSSRPLPAQLLSDLLWSAFGINRPQSGDRTAPSWRHSVETEIYLAMHDGVWRYEPRGHGLVQHLDQDIRAETGVQDFVANAPLNLVYVADGSRMGNSSVDEKRLYGFTDVGFIGQNVYLFCASEGLATVFRGSLDRDKLAKTLRLAPANFVTFAQTVGFPKV
jgi:nitroreductase